MKRSGHVFAIALLLASAASGGQPRLPSFFAPNQGQAPEDVRFVLKESDGSAFFHERGIRFQHAGADGEGMAEAWFVGAAPHPAIRARRQLEGVANFFEGAHRANWRSGVPLYEAVVYQGLWPGVELSYGTVTGGTDTGGLKSEFRIAAHGNPAAIRWTYGAGARLNIAGDGSLDVQTAGQTIREAAPVIYQTLGTTRKSVEGSYRIGAGGIISFRIGNYDHSRELVIDPVIAFSSYLGGTVQDSAAAIAVDSNGNIVIAGWTSSPSFPAASTALQPSLKGSVDSFVAKFGGTGEHLIFCTFLGGSGDDRAYAASLDPSGNIYVAGRTASTDFPVLSPLQPALRGVEDAFITKLTPGGDRLIYSTYLGGSNADGATAIAVDPMGFLYVAGDTLSTNFPVTGGYRMVNQGGQDAFVVKLTPAGQSMAYGTYLGGNAAEHAAAIAVNANGNAFVTGSTFSPNFPVVLAAQPATGGNQDAFVTELSVSGSALIFSTYLGGSGGTPGLPEEGDAIVLDAVGNIYVGGTTSSANFTTTASALQPVFGGGNQDAFLVRYNPDGQGVNYSSYTGGTGLDFISAMAIDPFGYLTVAGYTSSSDFPVVRAVQSAYRGNYDAFLAKFYFSGSTVSLVNSTYLGGSQGDAAMAVALDADGSALVAGYTTSSDFPVAAPAPGKTPLQTFKRGVTNAFVAKVANPFVRLAVLQTSAGPVFGVDYSRDRLWDGQTYTGGYSQFGNPGDIPLAGDWNHSGTVKIGVFRNGLWILDSNGNGVLDGGDRQFTFGQAGDLPVLGDWDGSGTLKAGLFRGGTWILDYSGHLQGAATGLTDKTFTYGEPSDVPVTGSWTGTSATRIGIFRAGFWILDADGDGVLGASDPWYLFGQAGDTPITGDWDGSGVTHPGIVRGSAWYLNYQWANEPGTLGSAGTERQSTFGAPGALALAGRNFN